MRWFFLGSTGLITLAIVYSASGVAAESSGTRPCATCASSSEFAPESGGLRSSIRGPVYCTNCAPCLDQAWVGYCQEKAHEQAFWSHIGSSSPLMCRITCRLEMIAHRPARCATTRSTGACADKCQAPPAPDAGSARPDAQPTVPDPPKPEKQSQRKGFLSSLLR